MRPGGGRITRLKRRLAAKGIQALLVTQRENIRYLTGFTGSAGIVLVTAGRTCLITDFRYMLQARAETVGVPILIQKTDGVTALKGAVARYGLKMLWFDEASVTVERYRSLKKLGVKLKGCHDIVADLRQKKDEAELASIRKAIRRAEQSFRELQKDIRPGAVERELALKLEYLMREKGSRKAAFDTIVASGRNGAMPHASVTNRRIRNGDLVTIDFGAEAEGYYCDITRTVCVGRPSARQQEIQGFVRKAQEEAIKAISPLVRCKTVDASARDVIQSAGHGNHFGHATGHGVGLMVHEGPALSALSKGVLEEGMVVTVEPGIYVPGWGGIRIEDMVLVTKKGAKVLTTLSRELSSTGRE